MTRSIEALKALTLIESLAQEHGWTGEAHYWLPSKAVFITSRWDEVQEIQTMALITGTYTVTHVFSTENSWRVGIEIPK